MIVLFGTIFRHIVMEGQCIVEGQCVICLEEYKMGTFILTCPVTKGCKQWAHDSCFENDVLIIDLLCACGKRWNIENKHYDKRKHTEKWITEVLRWRLFCSAYAIQLFILIIVHVDIVTPLFSSSWLRHVVCALAYAYNAVQMGTVLYLEKEYMSDESLLRNFKWYLNTLSIRSIVLQRIVLLINSVVFIAGLSFLTSLPILFGLYACLLIYDIIKKRFNIYLFLIIVISFICQ